jgi:Subtilase family/Secretion system C-terminal sorting domain
MQFSSIINKCRLFLPVILILSLQLFSNYSTAQDISKKTVHKFSPLLQQGARKSANEIGVYSVVVKNDTALRQTISKQNKTITVLNQYAATNTYVLKTNWKIITDLIASSDEVIFIDKQQRPVEEVAVSNLDLSTNKVNIVHSRYPDINGAGLTVSIKENRPDTQDIDFKGRYTAVSFTSGILSSHATAMATIAAGAGNSYYEGKGAARAAGIASANFSNLLPEPDSYYQQNNISVQNHSYGTAVENYYGAEALAYDANAIANPVLLHIFSAGNSGVLTPGTGVYSGIAGVANLTGNFKMSKNSIAVGHVDSVGIVLAPSSKGPAYDGRIKPELAAFGEDGSSGAAAIVSGTVLLVQDVYKKITGNLPSAALVKAILFNSADDINTKEIDFASGYGNVNALKAVESVIQAKYIIGSLANGGTNNHSLSIPANSKQLKITLVWNDPAAAVNAAKALVNDIDLELQAAATAEKWLPWVLSSFPHRDSLAKLPLRKRDSLNNAEQITIDNPAAGNYTILVKSFAMTSAAQAYSIVWQLDTADVFNWQYPTKDDNIFGGRENIVRWQANLTATTALAEYSTDNGINWILINNSVDLTKGYFKWSAPSLYSTALLRIRTGLQNFVSDTFTISERFDVNIGFNCPDSFLLFWNKVPGVTNYRVYSLGDKYMQPLRLVNDTAIVLAKSANTSLHYAVAPVIKNKPGVRSYAYEYTTQGVGCYIKNLLTLLNNNTAELTLELSTLYNIKKVVFEKQVAGIYQTIQSFNLINGLLYNYTDANLQRGLNLYRVKIELQGGKVIYSDVLVIEYFKNDKYIVYPNPVLRNQNFTVLTNNQALSTLQIININGVVVYKIILKIGATSVPTSKLSKGVYMLQYYSLGKRDAVQKLVVY